MKHQRIEVSPAEAITWGPDWGRYSRGVAPPDFNGKHPLFEDAIQPVHDHIGQVWLGSVLLPFGLINVFLARKPLQFRQELSLHQVRLAPLVDIFFHCMELRSKLLTTAMKNIEKVLKV